MSEGRSEIQPLWRAVRFYQKHNERTPDRWCWGVEDDAGFIAIIPEDDPIEAEANALLLARAPDLLVENERLRAWAHWVLNIKGDEPCRYDHHGYCQAHNLDERPCPVEQIADYFGSTPPP